jgi:pyrroline-5-carboxylate reductase
MPIRIAVLGAGNMGGALIGGIVNRVAPPASVTATTRTPERAAELSAKYGIVATAGGNLEAAAQADLIVVAVKPGTLPKVLTEIRDALNDQKILISLAAAAPISMIERLIVTEMPVFRAMPNIPVVVEEGATAIAANAACTPEHRKTVLGAAKLVRETGLHPAVLRDQVITPGGVTISAIHELERHGLRAMLISAIETATRHSEERMRALEAKTGK